VLLLTNFPKFQRTLEFITVFKKTHHWCPSRARSMQSIPPHSICLRSFLILSIIHVLVFQILSFLLAFPQKSYMNYASPHSCYVPCPSNPHWLDHSNYTWWRIQVMKLLIIKFSPTSCHLIPLRSKYSSAPCSQTPSVCVPPLTSDTKVHAHTESLLKSLFCIF
jgi:hypothetical protein